MRDLIVSLEEMGRPAGGEALARELAEHWRQEAGVDSSQYLDHVDLLALNLLAQRRPAEAEPLLRGGLALRQRAEPDAWTTFHTQWLLGAALLVQRSDAEADRFLREGYEGLVQRAATISADGKARLTDTGARVARLLASGGRNRDAAKWRREMAAVATSVAEAGTR